MGLFGAIASKLAPRAYRRRKVQRALEEWARSFEAAQSNRLNKNRWSSVKGDRLNDDLITDLPTLRARALHEAENNGVLMGCLETHATDIAGARGPTLQVSSDSTAYNQYLEDEWREWFRMPDLAERLPGPDLLQLWAKQIWTCGEFFSQVTNGRGLATRLTLRLNNIHPDRVRSPFGFDDSVVMGIELDANTRARRYHVEDVAAGGRELGRQTAIGAAGMLHWFRPLEVGQVRGFPLIAAVLDVIGLLRDFDKKVLAAADAAAALSVLLEGKDLDVDPIEIGSTVGLEPMTMSVLPPGYTAKQINPQQPSNMYKEFRAEKFREIGRVACMPLMIVLLDSSNHNYSSARFDSQVYRRFVDTLQASLERVVLDRCLALVQREAELLPGAPRRPGRLRHRWVWPALPHVDPSKEATAEEKQKKNLTLTLADALAARGVADLEGHVDQLAREKKLLQAKGLWKETETVAASNTPAAVGANNNG